jgi:hypothetical protein
VRKIGFKSFMYGMVKKATSSLFDEYKAAEKKKEDEAMEYGYAASVQGAYGTVSGMVKSLGFDPFAGYRQGLAMGQRRLAFGLQKALTPLMNQMRWAGNMLDLKTRNIWVDGAEGAAIGSLIGGAAYYIPYIAPIAPIIQAFLTLAGATLQAGTWEYGGYVGPGEPGRGATDLGDLIMGDPYGYKGDDDTGPKIDIWSAPSGGPTTIQKNTALGIGAYKLSRMEMGHWI